MATYKALQATVGILFWYLQVVSHLQAWSSQHIKMLGWVCGLGKCFSSLRSPKYWNQVGGGWKRVSCHGNQFLYSRTCVAFRTISSPSFNGLCCKLTEIALFIFLMFYWVGWMTSSTFSFAYFTHFSNLNISGNNADISKRYINNVFNVSWYSMW